MKLLIGLATLLILIKIYSYTVYNQSVLDNEKALEFIEYDLDSKRLDNHIYYAKEDILDLSRSNRKWYNQIKNLIDEVEWTKDSSAEEILTIFNNSKLRSIINYPNITYSNNKGLSDPHNRLLVLSLCYSMLQSELSEIKQREPLEIPYLVGLSRERDSMGLTLFTAIHDDIKLITSVGMTVDLIYNSDTIEVNSLPINIGPINGDVEFLFTDSLTNKKSWFRKRY